jgi:hypothetical protein
MQTSILSTNIPARQSLSDPLHFQGATVVGLVMPLSGWTPAVVSLQGSPLGTNFYDLFDGIPGVNPGAEVIFNVRPGIMVNINPNRMRCCAAIRLRSGTRDQPIIQAAARQFLIIVEGDVVQEPYPFPVADITDEPVKDQPPC